MKKLWQKNNQEMDAFLESFETEGDLAWDQKLVLHDVKGSLAHAKMLHKIGILTKIELLDLEKGLSEIVDLYEQGKFVLNLGDEDVHTKIEGYLTENYGEVGKKIHTARSRNDQVITALRLYTKDQLDSIEKELISLQNAFISFQKKHGHIPMPGYTHMQKAMPSSIELWIGSMIASLQDDLVLLHVAFELVNSSPLGSAAGYGVPLDLDRNYTAKVLGFSSVTENPLYVQNSRGKVEAVVLSSCISILQTINRFSSDVLLFTTSEFDFFSVLEKVTTGSSIMPQKKNVDLAELLRSKVHLVLGNYTQIVSLTSNLISGYNRDLQDTKKPLMESLEITLSSIMVCWILLESLAPNKKVLESSMTEELFATEQALKLVKSGMSFRDAYKKVGKKWSTQSSRSS